MHGLWVLLLNAKKQFVSDLPGQLVNVVYLGIVSLLGYLWTLAKNRYEQLHTVPDKQAALFAEADRLIKIRTTLASATEANPDTARAQEVIAGQLNQVVEQLSQSLTDTKVAPTVSPFVTIGGKYLLLYRTKGVASAFMHWTFYFLLLVWALFVIVGFRTTPNEFGTNITIAIMLAIPVVLWNYLTRKVDDWLGSRRPLPGSVIAPSK